MKSWQHWNLVKSPYKLMLATLVWCLHAKVNLGRTVLVDAGNFEVIVYLILSITSPLLQLLKLFASITITKDERSIWTLAKTHNKHYLKLNLLSKYTLMIDIDTGAIVQHLKSLEFMEILHFMTLVKDALNVWAMDG